MVLTVFLDSFKNWSGFQWFMLSLPKNKRRWDWIALGLCFLLTPTEQTFKVHIGTEQWSISKTFGCFHQEIGSNIFERFFGYIFDCKKTDFLLAEPNTKVLPPDVTVLWFIKRPNFKKIDWCKVDRQWFQPKWISVLRMKLFVMCECSW